MNLFRAERLARGTPPLGDSEVPAGGTPPELEDLRHFGEMAGANRLPGNHFPEKAQILRTGPMWMVGAPGGTAKAGVWSPY